MAGNMQIQVQGLDKLLAKLHSAVAMLGPALRTALTKSGLVVETEAKKVTPVRTGTLRRSITHRVDPAAIPKFAEVGTNLHYARYVHDGTRYMKGRPFLTQGAKAAMGGVNAAFQAFARVVEQHFK